MASPGPGARRLLVIGLDGVPSEFLFQRFKRLMPATSRLVDRGVRASLHTTDPPISVPAWPVMFTGVDPGTLGFYGFRHRLAHSYTETYVPTSTQVPVPTVFQIASEAGRRVAVIGMPMGYPPPHVNGLYISDFLTPAGATDYTYPPELAAEITSRFGPYPFDVVFRSSERQELFEQIVTMTRTRFSLAVDLIRREPWDLFAIHEVGTDRLHHAYWKYFDTSHPEYLPGNPFANVAEDYYRVVDEGIGALVEAAGPDTAVMITSDHGSMAMSGCFCINEWLAQRGYLRLARPVPAGTRFEDAPVDWDRTTVWGSGGYYARIFFNVRGREPRGIVAADQIGPLRDRLVAELAQLKGPDGRPMKVQVLDPLQIYEEVRGDAPDLMLYFGDLAWRSAGTLGYHSLFLRENDTGPDDAVHSTDGVFLFFDPRRDGGPVDLAQQSIRDVAPTVLRYLGLELPEWMQGRAIRLTDD